MKLTEFRWILPAVALALMPSLAQALDLNSFRAQHGKPALRYSAALAGAAQHQASSMARRGRIDHDNFQQRVAHLGGSTAAENVSYGCGTQDCAIRQWAGSSGHRANMLRGDVSRYGIASAIGSNGRRYWALVLGGG